MEPSRRRTLIYGLLLAAWALVLGWQTAEHFRVESAARAAVIDRAKDISTTLGIVLRSQRRFGVISKERLESALTELVRPGYLIGIALLNAGGDVVASAGTLADTHFQSVDEPVVRWDVQTVTVMNLVDLGTNMTHDIEGATTPIVSRPEDFFRPPETNRFSASRTNWPPPWTSRPEQPTGDVASESSTDNQVSAAASPTNSPWGRGGSRRPRFSRPPWMSEDEYKALIQKQGAHSFIIVMSTQAVLTAGDQDLAIG